MQDIFRGAWRWRKLLKMNENRARLNRETNENLATGKDSSQVASWLAWDFFYFSRKCRCRNSWERVTPRGRNDAPQACKSLKS